MGIRPVFGVFFSRPVSLSACFVLFLFTISVLPVWPASAQTQTLELGKPIERELAGGDKHQYQIGLITGRFLRVIVEQRGVDVTVALLAPDGKQLLEVDSPNGTEDEESLGWVTEAVGVYRLEVRSLEKDAAAGRYTVKLSELRAATADDGAALVREEQLRQASLLEAEAAGLAQSGKLEQAFSPAERALALREKALGAQHLEVGTALKNLADLRKNHGDYDKAESLYDRALVIREKALGAEHPNVAVTLAALADVYYFKSDLNRAESLYNRALAIVEKTLGPDHPNAALTLNNLAGIYTQRGDYAKAEPLQQRVLAMLEKYLGPENSSVATALNNLATINENLGNYPKAEALLQRALAMREKTLGAEHKDVAGTLNNLAYLYDATGEYAKSEKFYQRALMILEKQLGANHPDVATAVSNFGSLYQKKGDYARAEELYQRALTAREKVLGANHPDVALSLGNLSGLFQDRGDYVKAEALQHRALEILERSLGAEHPDTARTLNNLAAIYNDKGDYAQAETLHQRALAIREKALGLEHPSVATSLNNLAFLYNDKKEFDKAVPLLKRALAIWEKSLGANHPDVALALNNLAAIYERTGDFDAALPLHQRALALREQVFGAQHPTVANSLNNLAVFYFNKGDVAAAEPFAARALEIWEQSLGPEHPTIINALTNLMSICDRKGDYTCAVTYAVRAAEVSERNLALNLVAGSERQRLAYLTTYARDFDRYITLHVRHAPTDARARDLAVGTILRAKGRVLDATADSLTALRRRASPEDQALLDELRDANNQLAQFALDSAKRVAPEQRQRIKELEARKERLEAEVSRRNAEFRAQSQPITLAAVKAAIPADAALVEFFVYRPFDPHGKVDERYGSPRYVAYVLRRQGDAQWVELGEQAAIDATVAKLRAALRDRRRSDVKQLARAADEKVMRPVRKLLGQTQRVFLAPDGALNLLPFAAMADETGRYLIERYSFSYLTSGRDLLRLEVKQPNQQAALVVANPDFGEAAKSGEVQERILKYRPAKTFTGEAATLSEFYFPPLQGTAGEASALKAMMADAQLLTEAQAT
ncbi:MAG TPA: tetratricopeptide repeat protein, partial [Blastocatellia bacterium]|nr:tetratricopeptide repeat protein [Blastocatellia bacterium]